ncbi:hypothetical protein PgNI_06622 [Pyricularia grisea]|uniref:Major facilitator superfamily (MFS) profile domain-containing protein n=1 Tax=Pyricularia grisea TaxID=148305 RepID=A0A6P8B6D9_PYRGI|nr:hypothetical protein PgNI_06622 [Pyricularia grisea]TLD10825.1 hypothetical protein PgNI_06622 [Pyricularia grisea]
MSNSNPQPGAASSTDIPTSPVTTDDNIPAPAPTGITEEEIERLGRQRPAAFSSSWHEWCFCGSILGSMLMAEFFISGFIIVLPNVSQSLNMPPGTQTWPASVFTLVTGALLFAFGRIADMYGGRTVFLFGMLWYTLWILIAGFCPNHITLIVARAMQGIGPAAFLPSGVMLLGSTYRPGPRKNMVFSIYGSFAPIGFFIGTLAGGALAEFLDWRWYFWVGAIILFLISVASFFAIPSQPKDQPRAKEGKAELKMDWLGVATILPGLLLFVFAITQGAHAPQGFATPYVYVTLILGVLILGCAVYVEGWVAEQPLVPFDLFAPKYMTPMVLGLFNIYGSFGIFQFYASFYIQEVIGHPPLLAAAWFSPMAVGGTILAVMGGIVLHRIPSHLLLVFSASGSLASVLLFALIPSDPAALNYWAWVFTAMIGGTVGIDISYNISSVFMTTALPNHRQGLAGALINTLVFLGIGFYLGLADLIVQTTKVGDSEKDEAEGFRVAFWLGVGCSATALVIATLFTRIGRMKSDLTFDEKMELQAEAARLNSQVGGAGGQGETGSGPKKDDRST